MQRQRFNGLENGVMTNVDMRGAYPRMAEVRQFCELDKAGQQNIQSAHLAEALHASQ